MKTDFDKIMDEKMTALGLDPESVRRGFEFMSTLQEVGPEGRKNRLTFMRAFADLARKNAAVRSILTGWLDKAECKLPEEAATFRAYYLEGDTKPTARQLARRLCMDTSTVYHHNQRILSAMLPLAFGIYGIFQTDKERENAQRATRDRPEASQGTEEG